MAIQWNRVLMAGFASGLFILFSGVVLGHFVLGRTYVDAFFKHIPREPDIWTLVKHSSIRLGFGFLAAILVVMCRQALGVGIRPTIIAGVLLFAATYVPLTIMLMEFGILTGWRAPVTMAWSLGEAVVAALIAMWIYS